MRSTWTKRLLNAVLRAHHHVVRSEAEALDRATEAAYKVVDLQKAVLAAENKRLEDFRCDATFVEKAADDAWKRVEEELVQYPIRP